MTYDIIAAAERIAAEAIPDYDARSLRLIMIAAWEQAKVDLFITRADLDG